MIYENSVKEDGNKEPEKNKETKYLFDISTALGRIGESIPPKVLVIAGISTTTSLSLHDA
jgi:hypothetical protein